ncbi:MAG TPA: non-ribosomal peptide synthetase, partial [Blastocatellia bacterium]
AGHFVSALKLVLDDPAKPISRAELMREAEKNRLLVEWNRTDRAYPLDKTLIDFFHDRVAASPDLVAVEYEGLSLTYRQLNDRANSVAHRLLAAGVMRDDIVGITLDRSLEIVVAILGVLKSGGAYLPIDAQHPPERRNWMLENAAVKAVIGPSAISAPQVQVGDGGDEQEPRSNPERLPQTDSGCYVIYTSGSTGLPKGVVVGHRAIANNLLWMNDEWPLTEGDAVLFKSSPGFDVSVKEIFWPLIAGAKLVVAPPGASGDPEQLCRIIRNSRISVVHMVPTMLDYFLRHESASHIAHLRIVMCGGEALSPDLRARFHKAFEAVLLHLYGPTEAAIAVTGYAITNRHAEVERLPLGQPMPNCRIYVVDPLHQPVPIGVPGELCIAGTPLARGYLYRPDLTAERFVPDPFSGVPGSRMYLTGDLARWRPDAQVEYLGRIDRQIKLGGFRIEPGEIEAVIRAQEGVDDALVVIRESGGNNSLVAYVASRSPDISAETIQRGMRARLPAFMIPARFIIIPAFPTNVNGKVDMGALPPSDAMPARLSANPPQGELEEEVARVWCQVLNLEAADRDEDFFDLGGHSLLILQLQARLRDDLGYAISVADLFLHPTVASLAAHMSESKIWRARRWLKRSFETGRDSVR